MKTRTFFFLLAAGIGFFAPLRAELPYDKLPENTVALVRIEST
jgi:hypothetical protein